MKDPWNVWIGISVDETQRMKDSFVKYTSNSWPLIDAGMSRSDCRQYLEKRGWDVPKSSCIGCPFHDDHYWAALKRDSPDEFADAVDFDKQIRQLPRLKGETFIHRSATPLDEIAFDGKGQIDLFQMGECEGYCGV
jgi:glyoxylase-like metal-dependent hydrolase (beta-lactamase superfamily II)